MILEGKQEFSKNRTLDEKPEKSEVFRICFHYKYN